MTSEQTKTFDLSASFKAYDVRGIVGDSITAEIVEAVGAAFVDVLELEGQTVLVGGDMRPSSPEFSKAFADGAATRGANVQLLDLISTDELYYACGALNAAGATFTASHNPAEYNGIKMSKAGAVPISSESGLKEIQALAEQYLNAGSIPAAATRGLIGVQDVLKDYAEYLRKLVDLSGSRPLKVVVDAGNGMAGLTTPAVLGDALLPKLPLEIVPLYFELDGSFPNHPANPLEPENLRDLQAAVIEHGADIGLAFDGDADRCFVIDEKGDPVSPSAITGMVARREIARAKAQGEATPTIIHNLLTSRAVPELVAARRRPRRPHARGPLVHQGRHGRGRRRLRRRTLRPLLLPRLLERRHRHARRHARPGRPRRAGRPAVRARPRVRALRFLRRDQLRDRGQGRRRGARPRRLQRRGRRPSTPWTAARSRPATAATGSTCALPTPSRSFA